MLRMSISMISWLILCDLLIIGVYSSPCSDSKTKKIIFSIMETDPPGTDICTLPFTSPDCSIRIASPKKVMKQLKSYFRMDGDKLSVAKTVDLEDIYSKWKQYVFSIVITYNCNPPNVEYNIDIAVKEVNEFRPGFHTLSFNITVKENKKIGWELAILRYYTRDHDAILSDRDDLPSYKLSPLRTSGKIDGRSHFSMANSRLGKISLMKELDFDSMEEKRYELNCTVTDFGGLLGWKIMHIEILDIDDQGPEFYNDGCVPGDCHTLYTVDVSEMFTGPIHNIQSGGIEARDRDTGINNAILYTINTTDPNMYRDYFTQNSTTGVVSVIKALENATQIQLLIEAMEVSPEQRTETTTLTVNIKDPTNVIPPIALKEKDDTVKNVCIGLGIFILILGVLFGIGFIIFRKIAKTKKTATFDENSNVNEDEASRPTDGNE